MSDSSGGRTSKILRLVVMLAAAVFVLLLPVVVFLVNNRPPRISVYTPEMPKPNGWDDFVAAGRLIDKKHRSPYSDAVKPLNSWTIPQYEMFVRGNAPAVARLRLGLTRQYLQPPVRDGSLRFYGSFREMARVLGGEARYYQAIGEPSEALNCDLDAVELGVAVPRGGDIIAALNGCAVESIAMMDAPPALPKLNPKELTQVAQRLERIQRKRVPYRETVLEEGRTHAAMYAAMFRDPVETRHLASPWLWFGSGTAATSTGLKNAWVNARLAFTNKTAMIREDEIYYRAVAAEQRGPYTGKSTVQVPNNVLSEYIDTCVRARVSVATAEAQLTLLRVQVALLRYHFDHGRYPARLALLTPTYLKMIPLDPCGGKSLKYRASANGRSFLLYSIGPNLKDDGGKAGKSKGWQADGDLVVSKG